MFKDLINKLNSYFKNFPYEIYEQSIVINNLIKEKNNIINNEFKKK